MTDIDPENDDFSDYEEIDVNEEYPTLMQVARFADLVQKTPWFHHLGKPLTDRTLNISRDYLDALGFPESYPAEVPDWQEAISCLETYDWNSPAWEAEEQLAASLISDTLGFIEEDVLEVALTNVTVKAAEFINNAVETEYITSVCGAANEFFLKLHLQFGNCCVYSPSQTTISLLAYPGYAGVAQW